MRTLLLPPALLIASAGAVAFMLGLLGPLAGLVGLAAIGLGTLLAAPAARAAESGWWRLLAAGAAICAAGAAISSLSEAVGGLLAVIGGATVLVAAALGFPA